MSWVQIKSDPRARLKPCLRCGYSLRSLPDARNCPECGLAIWLSLSEIDDLEMSNPRWTRRLAGACVVLAAAHIAVAIVMIIVHTSARPMFLGGPRISWRSWVFGALPVIGSVHMALMGAGLLLLSGVEGRYPERMRNARLTAMGAAYASFAIAAWLIVGMLRPRLPSPVALALVVAHAVGVAAWFYLSQLARRIPSRRCIRFCNLMMIALGASLAWQFFNGQIWLYFAVLAPWRRTVLPWTIFLLLYPIAASALLLYMARLFQRAAKGAEKNWTSDPHG